MKKLLEDGFKSKKFYKKDNAKSLVSFGHFRETCIGNKSPLKTSFSFLMMGGLK